MKKNDLIGSINLASDVSYSSALQYNFINKQAMLDKNSFTANFRIEERTSGYNLAEKIRNKFFSEDKITYLGGSSISLVACIERKKEMIGYFIVTDTSSDIDYGRQPENLFIEKNGKYEITFIFNLEVFRDDISDNFMSMFPSYKKAKVNWNYMKDGRATVQEILIEDENIVRDEFYPFIQGGAKKMLKDYIASHESVLLMLGPPGTGKTSLLRHLICENNFHACMTYDKDIFTQDRFYLDYLLGDQNNLMIVEDADVLLEDRSRAGNDMMSKLLNFGDGLVKMPNKKMIFTTNITDVTKFDEALTRPGRCFGVVEFRLLTQEEANKAAEAADLPLPTGKEEYSLADIFSRKEVKKIRRFGFV